MSQTSKHELYLAWDEYCTMFSNSDAYSFQYTDSSEGSENAEKKMDFNINGLIEDFEICGHDSKAINQLLASVAKSGRTFEVGGENSNTVKRVDYGFVNEAFDRIYNETISDDIGWYYPISEDVDFDDER